MKLQDVPEVKEARFVHNVAMNKSKTRLNKMNIRLISLEKELKRLK